MGLMMRAKRGVGRLMTAEYQRATKEGEIKILDTYTLTNLNS